ncbi:hypothetical protein Plhal304r1_c010g0040861 [Plasmopara halstedii]
MLLCTRSSRSCDTLVKDALPTWDDSKQHKTRLLAPYCQAYRLRLKFLLPVNKGENW